MLKFTSSDRRTSTGWMWAQVHDTYLPIRIRSVPSGCTPLDEGGDIFLREKSLRESNLHKALGAEVTVWRVLQNRVAATSYDAASSALARLDMGESTRHFCSLAASEAVTAIATQPLSVVQSVQIVQTDAPIGFVEAWKAVRANKDKSLWDGTLARFLHCFASRTVQGVAESTLLNAFGVKHSFECSPIVEHESGALDACRQFTRRYALNTVAMLLVSRVAQFASDIVTSPLATVRWRMETQHATTKLLNVGYDSTLQCFRAVAGEQGGWRAFFRGIDHLAYGTGYDLAMLCLFGGVIASGVYALTGFSPVLTASLGGALATGAHSEAQIRLNGSKNPQQAEYVTRYMDSLRIQINSTGQMIR